MALTKRQMSNFRRRKSRFGGVVPVKIVKKTRKKRKGPRVTRMLKNRSTAHLRYVDTITIDAGSAAIASHVFRCNSLFDPDLTGTGHQFLMRDEYALLYGSYRVVSSKIKVTPVSSDTANITPSLYGVFRDSDVTLSYSLGTSVIEDIRNKGSWGVTTVNGNSFGRQPSKTASFNGKRDLSPEDAGKSHLQASNPDPTEAEAYFWQIWSASINGNNPGIVTFIVQIDCIVEFTDPAVVVPS